MRPIVHCMALVRFPRMMGGHGPVRACNIEIYEYPEGQWNHHVGLNEWVPSHPPSPVPTWGVYTEGEA